MDIQCSNCFSCCAVSDSLTSNLELKIFLKIENVDIYHCIQVKKLEFEWTLLLYFSVVKTVIPIIFTLLIDKDSQLHESSDVGPGAL